MLSKKICMVGAFAVGKTALVQQYVHSIFSEKYLSSVGVKISKKDVVIGGEPLNLILWDLEGQDDYSKINGAYLRGSMGIFLVADCTRTETLTTAMTLRRQVLSELGPDLPHVLLLNKVDLRGNWEVSEKVIDSVREEGVHVIETSAKTGQNVNMAFEVLAKAMLKRDQIQAGQVGLRHGGS